MENDVSRTMLDVAEGTRPHLRTRVRDMVALRERVEGHLNEETARWLASMPEPSQQIAARLVDAGGKRVRPMLSFLVAGAAGGDWNDARPVATAVELLHTGTLLHDDVIDQSDTRRGATAAHIEWDNSVAILTGDFCYFAALDALLELRDVTVMQSAMRVARALAHGELVQLQRTRSSECSFSLQECHEVMERKTASLFEFACEAAARSVGASGERIDAAATFGRTLGMAFQLVDDMLDFIGDASELGKAAHQDVEQGCVTVPLLLADRHRPGLIRDVRAGRLSPPAVHDIVVGCGALDEARDMAQGWCDQGQTALLGLPATPERAILAGLSRELIRRTQ